MFTIRVVAHLSPIVPDSLRSLTEKIKTIFFEYLKVFREVDIEAGLIFASSSNVVQFTLEVIGIVATDRLEAIFGFIDELEGTSGVTLEAKLGGEEIGLVMLGRKLSEMGRSEA